MSSIAARLTKAEARMPAPASQARIFRAIIDPRRPETMGGAAELEARARADGWSGKAFLIDRVIVYPEPRR